MCVGGGLRERKKRERCKKTAQRRQTKYSFGFDDDRFHMFTDNMLREERGGSYKELHGLLNPCSHGHCSAHSYSPRLGEDELSVGDLIWMEER